MEHSAAGQESPSYRDQTSIMAWACCDATSLRLSERTLRRRRVAGKLVYGKIRAAVGVRRAVVSGGGSLQPHLDDFFEVIGLTVLNGWGLSVRGPPARLRRPPPLPCSKQHQPLLPLPLLNGPSRSLAARQ